jgi:glycosyltransferase involved in cell wall biosynthesis
MGAANDRIHVVANGIDAPPGGNAYQRPGILRTRYSIAADEQIVLFLGRINHKKGTDLLVKAYAQLPERIREHSYLIIAGPDDGQLDEVLTLVNAHGLQQRAIFTGLLNDEEVWSAYADTDLFVLPCRTDTFPMAIVEACAANVPMVLTDTCEIADMFREKAATVIPVEIQKIAEGIEQLLENECLRQQYRVGMAEIMRNHLSIEVIGDALEAVYSDASERHHSAV